MNVKVKYIKNVWFLTYLLLICKKYKQKSNWSIFNQTHTHYIFNNENKAHIYFGKDLLPNYPPPFLPF